MYNVCKLNLFLYILDIITITKHPYVSGKIAQGMSVCLTCEAVSSSHPVHYQWFKNGRPLQGK